MDLEAAPPRPARARRALGLAYATGRHLSHVLRALPHAPPGLRQRRSLHADALLALRRRGFAVLEGYYGADHCARLRDEIERLLVEHADRVNLSRDAADRRVFAAERASAPIDAFYRDGTLHEMAEAFAGVRVLNGFTLAARLVATRGNVGSGDGWHRDSFETPQCKAILYLSDVGPDEGPFQYVPGSAHLRRVLRSIWTSGLGARQQRLSEAEVERVVRDSGLAPVTLTGAAGTLILADTSGIHRGAPIHTGRRYALTNYYFLRHRFGPRLAAHFNDKVKLLGPAALDAGDTGRFFPELPLRPCAGEAPAPERAASEGAP